MSWKMLRATLMIAGLAGCASPMKVSSDYYREADFSSYRTFSFMPGRALLVATTQPVSPLLEGRLMAAAADVLSTRGYRQVDNPDQADFILSFTLGERDQISVNNYPEAYRETWRLDGPNPGSVEVRTYTEGTLSIDMFEVKTRQPVWFGRASRSLTQSDRGNPALVKEVVSAILKQFPPS